MAYTTPTPAVNINARVFQALNYLNSINNTYLVLGQADPWDNDTNPPIATTIETIDKPIGYIKPVCYVCYQVSEKKDDSTISYGGKFYQPSDSVNAYTNKATFVYYTATINPDSLSSLNTFRQISLNIGVTPRSGITQTQALTPTNVSDSGLTHVLINTQPFIMTEDRKIKLSMLLSITTLADNDNLTTMVTPTTTIEQTTVEPADDISTTIL